MLNKIKDIVGVVTASKQINLPHGINNIELANWLHEVGENDIEMEWSAENLTLYGANNFIERKKGYTKETKNSKATWNENWVAIGDVHSDPIICDFSFSPCKILYARHGQGFWDAKPLASSFSDFAKSLEFWCEIFYSKFNKEILNDEYEVLNIFKKELSNLLKKLLSEKEMETFLFAVDG